MSDDAINAIREMIAENPCTLNINGKPLKGYAGEVVTVPGGDGEAAESSVDIAYLGEKPNEGEPVSLRGREWLVADFSVFGDAVTGRLTSSTDG